jgi:hypothetical protein
VSPRRRLFRWAGWFAAVNAGALAVIGLRYLWLYVRLSPSVAWVYAVLAYVGHMSALAGLPLLVLLVPVILLIPHARLVVVIGVAVASAVASFLLLDSLVFAENRYHLAILTLSLLAPQTFAFLGIYFVVGVVIESMLAAWIWARTATPPRRRLGRYVALALVGCFVAGNLMHAWGEARYQVAVTAFTRYLPLYHPLKDTKVQLRLGLIDRAQAREHGVMAALGRSAGELNYPLAPLRCEPLKPLPNVLMVVIDAMRADALNPTIAPRISRLAQEGVRFDAHYSGGNASRTGMFSLFYGLPATYWDAFAAFARPPLLMDLFRQHGYQLGIFASSPLDRIGLDRTVLARVPNLRLGTASIRPGSSGRDRTLTEEWYAWLDRRDPSRRFFGLLFYNAVVAMEPPDGYPAVVPVPAGGATQARLYAQYQNAVHFVDGLVGGVLDDLERRKLLAQTVVLVTADHGMEFDENGEGFTGHATSYSSYQMHIPLVLRWPGHAPAVVTRRTSHNDVAPTLLDGLFGCANPPSDYASGRSLFGEGQWDWLVAASYNEFALIEPERVTIVYPASYEVRDRGYHLVRSQRPPRDSLFAAQREMSRFYR